MDEGPQNVQAGDITRTNYRLRSAFFYLKLKGYQTLALVTLIAELLPSDHLLNWEQRATWGISESAFAYIMHHPDLHPIHIFCHPRLLREHPRLIAYYRNIASISQKGAKALIGFDVAKYEADFENKRTLAESQAIRLAATFNEHASLIIDTSVNTLTGAEVNALLFASIGVQIDSSWRNAVGFEAQKVVQRLLIKDGITRNIVAGFLLRKGSGVDIFTAAKRDEQLGNINDYRGFILTNQTSIIFAPDPDISLLDKDGRTVGVIEVKGGLDPAGALERYGAALKSFEPARKENSGVATILVESIVTTELAERLAQNTFIEHYLISDILDVSASKYNQFMARIFALLHTS